MENEIIPTDIFKYLCIVLYDILSIQFTTNELAEVFILMNNKKTYYEMCRFIWLYTSSSHVEYVDKTSICSHIIYLKSNIPLHLELNHAIRHNGNFTIPKDILKRYIKLKLSIG